MNQNNNISVQKIQKNADNVMSQSIANLNEFRQLYQKADSFLLNFQFYDTIEKYDENQRLNAQKQIYSQALQFGESLNKFLGKSANKKGVYVYENEDGTLSSYIIPLDEFYQNFFGAGGKIFAQSATLLKKLQQYSKMEENSSHKEEAFLAYNATKNRLEQYYNQIGNRVNMGVLMWKEGYSWISAKVLNYGDIKEAYFDFLTIQHNTNLICSLRDLGQPPYYSHELVKYFFEDFIAKVDSGSAIAGEDVKRNGVEYAVKGQGANLPGLIQYANLANQIVIGKISSQEEIEKYLKKHQGGTRNHIENAFDKTTEKVLKNVKSMLETGKL